MRDGCLDFRTGYAYDLQTYFDERTDIHHICPQAWCQANGIDARRCDCVVNKTPISAKTNRMIGGTEALASYGYKGGPELRTADLRALIPAEHFQFLKGCRDYFETVRHVFVHAYYEPDRPLHGQRWGGLRWASLPPVPARHCSGKVAVVGHTPQKNGEVLDLGYLKCIDTFCHGGGWLTALEVGTGKVWQANLAGEMRQ